MAKLRFFTDEDVYRATTLSLRKVGFDVISLPFTGVETDIGDFGEVGYVVWP